MMEAVGTDHRIKRILSKRKIFAVAYDKFRVGKLLCLSDLDHFRSEVETDIMFIRVFLMDQFKHRSGSTATVEHIVERLLFQFCQDRRVIILTHFINTGMSTVVNLGCLCEFFDRKLFIFFRCHKKGLLNLKFF